MSYEYGKSITVSTPDGRAIPAQVGDWNNGDPVIHVRAYQIEMPESELRSDGWGVPQLSSKTAPDAGMEDANIMDDFDGKMQDVSSFHDTGLGESAIKSAALRIINTLLSEEGGIPMPASPETYHHVPQKQYRSPVGRGGGGDAKPRKPSCRNCGSYTHTADRCPMQGAAVL